MEHTTHIGSLTSYLVGFFASLLLTSAAFAFVLIHDLSHHTTFSHHFLFIAILIFALLQLAIQLVLFLHVGRESKPYWNTVVLVFAGFIVFIVMGGTLWIMNNLQHGNMPSTEPFTGNTITPQTEND